MHVMPLCKNVLITTFLCMGICKRLKGNTDALLIAFISMVLYLLTCTCTFAADVTSPQDKEAGSNERRIFSSKRYLKAPILLITMHIPFCDKEHLQVRKRGEKKSLYLVCIERRFKTGYL